jgi:DNA-binding winged helix-turn-helix (wHTH) protein
MTPIDQYQLLERVWPGLIVEENNLQVQVSALRKLLGQDAIATVAGRGYRFTLESAKVEAPLLS